jgi:hypothetical protein
MHATTYMRGSLQPSSMESGQENVSHGDKTNSEEEHWTKKQMRPHPTYQNKWPVAMNTYSGSHRDLPMETPGRNESLGKERPLPIILALEANLSVASRELFWNIAAATHITTSMVDYNATLGTISTALHFIQRGINITKKITATFVRNLCVIIIHRSHYMFWLYSHLQVCYI